MIEESDFEAMVQAIIAQGYDQETAGDYAARIGDTPVFDDDGMIIIRDGDEVVARLKPFD